MPTRYVRTTPNGSKVYSETPFCHPLEARIYPATFREFLLMHMDADTLRTIADNNAGGGGHCLTTDKEIHTVYEQYRDELFNLAYCTWIGYRNPDWSTKNRNLLPISESCQAARYIRSVSRWSYDRSAELNDWMVMVPADNASCPSRFESWLVWLCAEVKGVEHTAGVEVALG